MCILRDLSEFVPTAQVKWSTCLFPVETDPPEYSTADP